MVLTYIARNHRCQSLDFLLQWVLLKIYITVPVQKFGQLIKILKVINVNSGNDQSIADVVRCIIKRTKVAAQWNEEFSKNQRLFISHLIDVVFILFIQFIWNTQASLFPPAIFQPTPFPNLSNALYLTPLICFSMLLFISPPLTPHSTLTCPHLI